MPVQEAVVNAFVHRDYHSYEPVRVTIFNDRLEITSPGGAPAPMDPGKMETVRELAAISHSFFEWIPGLPLVPMKKGE